ETAREGHGAGGRSGARGRAATGPTPPAARPPAKRAGAPPGPRTPPGGGPGGPHPPPPSPAVARLAPSQSSPTRCSLWLSGAPPSASQIAAAASGTLRKKIARQDTWSVRNPPSIGPSAIASAL